MSLEPLYYENYIYVADLIKSHWKHVLLFKIQTNYYEYFHSVSTNQIFIEKYFIFQEELTDVVVLKRFSWDSSSIRVEQLIILVVNIIKILNKQKYHWNDERINAFNLTNLLLNVLQNLENEWRSNAGTTGVLNDQQLHEPRHLHILGVLIKSMGASELGWW